MIPAITEPSAAHRAALALHALAEADRAWVLDALGMGDRDRLHPLLHELEELGIPRDPALVETLAPAEPQPQRQAQARERHALDHLTNVRVHRLAQVLAGEPPRLAAALVASRRWPWREQLLACLPGEVAREVDRLTAAATPASALHAAVVAEVSSALQDMPADVEGATRWHTLRGRFAALRRKG